MAFLESTKKFNVISPINQLGYGVTGLNVIKSLLSNGHDVSLFVLGQLQADPKLHDFLKGCFESSRMPDFDAPCLRIWHQHDMSEWVGSGEKIGFPIFELNKFTPQEIHHLKHPDKLFVCSQWAKDIVLEQLGDSIKEENVYVIPLGVDRSIFRESISSRPTTTFINIGKWEIRKGHDILIEAFNRAFTEDDNVELWMMCDNPFHNDEQNFEWERKYRGSGLGEKVRIIPRQDSQQEVYNIMSQVDCGVFPSRAEGWNLELLEMLACGKHVIATDYSGHTEFCNKENARLVEVSELEDAKDGIWFHGQGQWAHIGDKEIDQIAEHMREIHKLKQEDELNINQAGIDTSKEYSWDNTVAKILEAV